MRLLILVILVVLGIYGCSPTKKLPPKSTLLGKQEIVFTTKNKEAQKIASSIQKDLRPKPNKKFLGVRVKLFFYNLVDTPKKKGLRHIIKNKMGEPPVLAKEVNMQSSEKFIENTLINNGFFRANTVSDSLTTNKITTFTYKTTVQNRYRIRNIIFPNDTLPISLIISNTKKKSLLKRGAYYNLETIKEERGRIDEILKQKGYFYFNPDYIVAQVDSNHNGFVDIYIKVKQDAPEKSVLPYRIDRITVYPSYSIQKDSLLHTKEGIITQGIEVIDPRNRYRPSIFAHAIQFRPGELYTRKLHSRSLTRMVNLDAFQFVNLTFNESDTGKLNATFYLTPAKRNTLNLGITTSTKSNNYFNTELKATVKNRNLFKGAEIFELNASSGINTQIGGNKSAYNTYTLASDFTIYSPRLITPFKKFNWMQAVATRTKATVGYELVSKQPDYTIHSINGSFGYIWKKHEKDEHELTLLNINLVRPANLSNRVDSIINTNPSIKQSLTKQLILGVIYNFTYSNQFQTYKKHQYYLNATQEFAGNTIDLFKGGRKEKYQQNELFGIPYSQYSRTTIDYRSFIKIDNKNTWVNRIYVGVGIPYGNSEALPYTKKFYSGGSNSLRGFRAYTLGPGEYRNPDTKQQTNQTGDIKLELNSEYRANIWSIIKGAVFIDAGNVWLLRNEERQPNANFLFNRFYKQLGVSTGMGIRFDLTFLILRFDIATPIRKPYLPNGKRWVFNKINLRSKEWRKENLILNVAIGYPF
jgi:outer membrane protein assembly factor BamA